MSETDKNLQRLSQLILRVQPSHSLVTELAAFDHEQRSSLLRLANAHHVVIRALKRVQPLAVEMGFLDLAQWVENSAAAEEARITAAVWKLGEIHDELAGAGCQVTVLKSLDHWPDLGRDLDLYTSASMAAVKEVLCRKFQAKVLPRSLGDCLASKCSFNVPGLDRTIEVHSGRLGQAGEHVAVAARVERRRVQRQIAGHTFYVPAAEEQVVAATLQRMYRHLFFRLCDIVNTAGLVESGAIDYAELREAALPARIWSGVSTFLVIVSDYVKHYRGSGLALPQTVLKSSLFGAEKFFLRGQYLRLPLLPEAARLYGRQITGTALRGNLPGAFRLSLLPPLASVAALAYKVTGSNQGIW